MNQNQNRATQINNGRLFFRRSVTYKIGFFLLFPSFILYLISFGSSTWFRSRSMTFTRFGTRSFGLWHTCNDRYLECNKRRDVFMAVQIMSCFCLAGYFVTFCLGFYENCLTGNYRSRKTAWASLITATVGTITGLLFIIFYTSLWRVNMGSSYGVNGVAILLLFVAGVMMAYGNRPQITQHGLVVTNTPLQQTTMTTVYYQPPGPQVQTHIYNFQQAPPPAPIGAPYHPANQPLPPPAYGAYPAPSPASPPPPYMLPPTYPQTQHGDHQ